MQKTYKELFGDSGVFGSWNNALGFVFSIGMFGHLDGFNKEDVKGLMQLAADRAKKESPKEGETITPELIDEMAEGITQSAPAVTDIQRTEDGGVEFSSGQEVYHTSAEGVTTPITDNGTVDMEKAEDVGKQLIQSVNDEGEREKTIEGLAEKVDLNSAQKVVNDITFKTKSGGYISVNLSNKSVIETDGEGNTIATTLSEGEATELMNMSSLLMPISEQQREEEMAKMEVENPEVAATLRTPTAEEVAQEKAKMQQEENKQQIVSPINEQANETTSENGQTEQPEPTGVVTLTGEVDTAKSTDKKPVDDSNNGGANKQPIKTPKTVAHAGKDITEGEHIDSPRRIIISSLLKGLRLNTDDFRKALEGKVKKVSNIGQFLFKFGSPNSKLSTGKDKENTAVSLPKQLWDNLTDQEREKYDEADFTEAWDRVLDEFNGEPQEVINSWKAELEEGRKTSERMKDNEGNATGEEESTNERRKQFSNKRKSKGVVVKPKEEDAEIPQLLEQEKWREQMEKEVADEYEREQLAQIDNETQEVSEVDEILLQLEKGDKETLSELERIIDSNTNEKGEVDYEGVQRGLFGEGVSEEFKQQANKIIEKHERAITERIKQKQSVKPNEKETDSKGDSTDVDKSGEEVNDQSKEVPPKAQSEQRPSSPQIALAQRIMDFFIKKLGIDVFAPMSEFYTKLEELGYAGLKAEIGYNYDDKTDKIVTIKDLEGLGFEELFYTSNPDAKKLKEFQKWLNDNPNTVLRLYHGTDKNADILGQGLLKTSNKNRKSYQSESGYVYLSPFEGTAKTFGEMANPYGSKVYSVDVPIRYLLPDKDQLNNKRAVGFDIGNSLAESIVYGRSVRVKDNIPPFMIKEIRYIKTPSGKIYGFTYGGKIYLNPEFVTGKTVFHELTHIQQEVIKQAAKKGDVKAKNILARFNHLLDTYLKQIEKGAKVVKIGGKEINLSSSIYRKQEDETAADYRDRMADELWAYLQAPENLAKFDKGIVRQFIDAVADFFRKVLGIEKKVKDIQSMNLRELIGLTSDMLAKGEYLKAVKESNATSFMAEAEEAVTQDIERFVNALNIQGLGQIKLTETPRFMAEGESDLTFSEKRNLYKKAFGEQVSRIISGVMPVAFDKEKALIPYLKRTIPILSSMPFILKEMGQQIEKNFLSEEEEIVVDSNSPFDLMRDAGYLAVHTKSEDEVLQFRTYYDGGNGRVGGSIICTYNDVSGRLANNHIIFITKADAADTVRAEDLTQENINGSWAEYLEKIGRKNEDGTYNLKGLKNRREDPFGVSVLSIQLSKRGGSHKIINRYNHTINEGNTNPDATYGNNLNGISEGLSSSLYKYFNLEKVAREEYIPDGIVKNNGQLFKYGAEEEGVYYGEGFYIRNGLLPFWIKTWKRWGVEWYSIQRGALQI